MEPVILFQDLKDTQEEVSIAKKYFAAFNSPEEIPIGSRVICRYFIREPYMKLEKLLSERVSYLLNTREHLCRTMDFDHRMLTEYPSQNPNPEKKDPDYRVFFLRGIPIQICRKKLKYIAQQNPGYYWMPPALEPVPPSVLECAVKIAKRITSKNGLPFFYLDLKESYRSDWKLERIGDACFTSLEGTDVDLFYRNLRTALLKYRREAEK